MEKALGAEAKFTMKIVSGKLELTLDYDGKGVDGQLKIVVEPDYFIDELGKVIPGDTAIETFTLGALKAAFHSAKV